MVYRVLALSLLLLCCRTERLVQVPPCEPSEEVCNGRDDDCDEQIDEYLWQECQNECGPGRISCEKGEWSACSARLPTTEICNGVDDDCDGIYDEDIPTMPCYPLGLDHPSLDNGTCNYGKMKCVFGSMVCKDATLPQMETCDGLDNNCDGESDEGTEGSPLDVVFAVDYSGSMIPVIQSLITITSDWAIKYAPDGGASDIDVRFCLVGIPPDDPSGDSRVRVLTDFLSPGAFAAELARHPNANGGGIEPQLDAIYWTALPTNPLNLKWRPGTNHAIVVYTDEMPQTYGNPTVVTEQMAWDAAVQDALRVFVFTSDSSWSRWSPRPLNLPPAIFSGELDKVIEEAACKGM